ncbi:MAG: EamA family transporter [Betaproteobacteria bacterium]|nr:EamA family transporter [Betaproteobacteria bacterium]
MPADTSAAGQRTGTPRWLPYAVLAAGVCVVSTASILIRYAQHTGTGSLSIAALRLSFATLLLSPYAWPRVRSELPRAKRSTITLAAVSGLVLAIHFATWITSLEYTSVAASAVLVTTNPIWVGIAAWLWLREPPSRTATAGIVLGVGGSVFVFATEGGHVAGAAQASLGNALALVGALMASTYLLIGRRLRGELSLTAYIWIAYGVAAATLVVTAWIAGQPLVGLPALAYVLTLLLAAGPQLIGHTTFNWAVRRLPAPTVAMAILGEPVGAAILAWVLFGERASPLQMAGFGLLLAGVYVTARAEAKRRVAGS